MEAPEPLFCVFDNTNRAPAGRGEASLPAAPIRVIVVIVVHPREAFLLFLKTFPSTDVSRPVLEPAHHHVSRA